MICYDKPGPKKCNGFTTCKIGILLHPFSAPSLGPNSGRCLFMTKLFPPSFPSFFEVPYVSEVWWWFTFPSILGLLYLSPSPTGWLVADLLSSEVGFTTARFTLRFYAKNSLRLEQSSHQLDVIQRSGVVQTGPKFSAAGKLLLDQTQGNLRKPRPQPSLLNIYI